MDTAKQVTPEESEPLSWTEICARYPDQHVCLVDIEDESDKPQIKTARVIGHGPTERAAFEPVRELCWTYPGHAVMFTGVCTGPFIRPSLVIDDETLAILQRPIRIFRL